VRGAYNNRQVLADQIERLVQDDGLRQRLQTGGYELAINAHTFAHRIAEVVSRHGLPVNSAPG
jgi:spore maturation protein CgeB